jgi:hypothetical protein
LFTFDVTSLYTVIPINVAISMISDILFNVGYGTVDLRRALSQGVAMVLNNNFFKFGDNVYRQVSAPISRGADTVGKLVKRAFQWWVARGLSPSGREVMAVHANLRYFLVASQPGSLTAGGA